MFQGDVGPRAGQRGRAIRKWLTETTVTNAYVVSTSASIYYDIPEGKQAVIARTTYGCHTINEEMACYPVSCSEKAGGGDATQLARHSHDYVGDKKEGSGSRTNDHRPPIVVKYSDGARSVSIAVKATDAATVVCFGWNGWVEDEGTLS